MIHVDYSSFDSMIHGLGFFEYRDTQTEASMGQAWERKEYQFLGDVKASEARS